MSGVPLEDDAVLVAHRHRDHVDDAPVVADRVEAITRCLLTYEDLVAATG